LTLYAVGRLSAPCGAVYDPSLEVKVLVERPEVQERGSWYTVVGVIDDGTGLNQAVKEVRELGVDRDDLTVVLKRVDSSEPEPFPDGTRYIVVPADRRGLEVPLGFAVAFIVFGIFFALTTPAIGIPTLLVFVSLAIILFAASLTRVGVNPILMEMEAPQEEADSWNDQFEFGKVLVFASTRPAARRRDLLHSGPAAGAPGRPPGNPAPNRRTSGGGIGLGKIRGSLDRSLAWV
jgi:hypothetical protein